jgi:hypothetical protein
MNIMSISRTHSGVPLKALVCLCVLATGGCVNLDDVAGLTKLADSAQRTLPAVVADIPSSCLRQNTLLNEIPTEERPASLKAQDCKPYQDVAEHLSKDQNVLIAYFDSLGKLSANAPLSYDKNIDTDVSTVEKLPNLSKGTIAASSAAQKIAKVLADAATKAYREHEVNSIIKNTDAAIQELTADLKKVVVVQYTGILSNEGVALDTYYQGPMAAAGKSERLALIVVQRQYDGDTAALQSRKSAAIAYGKVMDNLASLHTKLRTEAMKKASLRDIAEQIGPDISNLKDAISELQARSK